MSIKVLTNAEVQGLCVCVCVFEVGGRERERGNEATKISSVVLPFNMGHLFFITCS